MFWRRRNTVSALPKQCFGAAKPVRRQKGEYVFSKTELEKEKEKLEWEKKREKGKEKISKEKREKIKDY